MFLGFQNLVLWSLDRFGRYPVPVSWDRTVHIGATNTAHCTPRHDPYEFAVKCHQGVARISLKLQNNNLSKYHTMYIFYEKYNKNMYLKVYQKVFAYTKLRTFKYIGFASCIELVFRLGNMSLLDYLGCFAFYIPKSYET